MTSHWTNRRPLPWVALGLVVALAATLRFAAVTARGFIYWDEGKFALEGIRFNQALHSVIGLHAQLGAGKAVGTAKPGHALLIGIADALLGIHDYSSLLLNAFASTVAVVLAFLLGRQLFGPLVGVLGAVFLAVSEYDVIYARSALSESDAVVFFLGGALCCFAGQMTEEQPTVGPGFSRLSVLGGLLLGFGISVNYRLVVYVAVLIGVDLLLTGRRVSSQLLALRLAGWLVGIAVILGAWQIAGIIAAREQVELFRGEINRVPLTYLDELRYQLHEGKQSVLHFSPLPYLQWWVVRQGWPASLLLVAGLVCAVVKRERAWVAAMALAVIPYVVYAFAPFYVPRNLTPSLPFASILSAAALVELCRRLRHVAVPAGVILAALVAGLGAWMSWRLTVERSGFALAAHYVEKRGHGRALISNEVMVFYLRGQGRYCSSPALPLTLRGLSTYRHAGYRYAVLDSHHSSAVSVEIMRQAKLVARFSADGPLQIGESPISTENSGPPGNDNPFEFVEVYQIDRMRLPHPGRARAVPCQRDDVT